MSRWARIRRSGSRQEYPAFHEQAAVRVLIWDLEERRVIQTLPVLTANCQIALSLDGRRFALGDPEGFDVNVWDARSGDHVGTYLASNDSDVAPGGNNFRNVTAVAFSADRRHLAAVL